MKERVADARRPGRAPDVGVHVPLRVRAHPAARGVAARLPLVVLDLRPVRRRPPHRLRAPRPRPRPEAVPAPPSARRDLGAEERAGAARGVRRPAIDPAREAARRGVPRVPAPAARRVGRRLRRPARAHGAAVPRAPRRAGALAHRFHHVLVDEFQDTNLAQWELVRMLTEEHRNVMVVGDTDQCLVEGTQITMGDGSHRPIEQVRQSATRCCPATAAATSARHGSRGCTVQLVSTGIAITLASGRESCRRPSTSTSPASSSGARRSCT